MELIVSDLLTRNVLTVPPETTLDVAAQLMSEKHYSCMVAVDAGKPVGILTESDLVRIGYLQLDPSQEHIAEFLSQPVISVVTNQTVYEAFEFLLEHRVRHLVAVHPDGTLEGILTFSDILKAAEFDDFMRVKKVSSVMSRKLVTMGPGDAVLKAMEVMSKLHISCVVVLEGDKGLGIFSERDAANLVASGADTSALTLSDVMTSPLKITSQDESLLNAYMMMRQLGLRRLVIADEAGKPTGLITQFDVIRGMEDNSIRHLKKQHAKAKSELVEAHKLLSEKSELERIVGISPAVLYRCEWDAEEKAFTPVWISDAITTMLGYDQHECLQKDWRLSNVHPDDRQQMLAEMASLLEKGEIELSYRFMNKSGAPVWVHDHMRLSKDKDGVPREIIGSLSDMSQARQSEDQFHSLFNDAKDMIYISDAEGRVTDVNRAGLERMGYSREEMIGSPMLDFVHAESMKECQKCFETLRGGCPSMGCERMFLSKAGEEIWVEASASAQFDAQGNVISVREIMHDVTQRKQAELALRESESKYRALFESSSDAIMLLDRNGFYDCNSATLKMFNCPSLEAFRGHHPSELSPPTQPDGRSSKEAADEKIASALQKGTNIFEWIHRRSDGEDFPAEVLLTPLTLDGRDVLQATVRDITERNLAEEAIRKSESRLQASQAISHTGTWDWNPNSGELIWSDETYRIHGYEPGEVEPSYELFLKHVHPEDRGILTAAVEAALNGERAYSVDCRLIADDGVEKITHAQGEVEVGDDGSPVRMLGVFQDITESKLAEQRLKDSEMRMQQIVSASPMPMLITRLSDGQVLFSNAEVREMFAVEDEQEALGFMSPDGYVRGEDRVEAIRQLESSGAFKGELELKRMNGESFWALASARIMEFGDETAIIVLLIDMTPQRLLEEQFREAQKMESVGTLVGGIAHDFNNMLAGMLGQLYLVRHDLRQVGEDAPRTAEIVARINAVENQGRLAAEVIAQLMTFARKGQVVMKRVDVNHLVADAMRLHRVTIPEDIKVEVHLAAALNVEGDAGMIQQMLLNLLTNARDALEGQPEPHVDVSISRFVPDADFLQRHVEFENIAYACLCVRDNGCGMGAHQTERIFEPFFTTKEVGKGTGLGLAMLYGGMQTHNGHIVVESKPGEGCCFKLYFPLLKKVEEVVEQQVEKLVSGSGQCILLVDDEAGLLEVMDQSLQLVGYQVLTAQNGEEAVDCFMHNRERIALAIMDVVMPVKGGVDAAREMRELAPDLPLIFHTGYDEESRLKEIQPWKSCVTVKKPANIERLSTIIADMLEGS